MKKGKEEKDKKGKGKRQKAIKDNINKLNNQ